MNFNDEKRAGRLSYQRLYEKDDLSPEERASAMRWARLPLASTARTSRQIPDSALNLDSKG